MIISMHELLRRAEQFRQDDLDPDTQAELDTLLARVAQDEAAMAELRERFMAHLRFGTAGLRGLLGAGDNRMNLRVVARTTAALCAELELQIPNARERGLCVAFDGRHKSRAFADEVQAVANGAGFVVHVFEEPVPTPLLAYAVLATGAAAGVMITASHNPAAYNGYKVYWQNGAQLNTPHDSAIAQRVERGPGARELPRIDRATAQARGLWRSLEALPQRYLAELQQRLHGPCDAEPPRVAYSAMHGVGEPLARAALQLAGVDDFTSVAEQAQPNPDFPTLPFPNPEEPGALDRLLKLARETRADLALANDPDADRLAAAVPGPDGEPRALSGNELGALLCDYLLAQPARAQRLVVTTIVTSPLAQRIGRAHGAHVEITLTGFKWIMAKALELEARGMQLVLAFEEALGYCVGDLVRDKDGIAGTAHVAQMARWHAARGRSLQRALEELYVQHGLWKSRGVSIALSDHAQAEQVRRQVTQLRRKPPSQIAGLTVSNMQDLLYGPNPTGLPASDVFIFQLEGGQRVTVRPSGTEPKLKLYLDCNRQVGSLDELASAHTKLEALLDRIEHSLRSLLLARP